MRMKKPARKAQRGVTLIETVIAMFVLVTGIAAVFGMASHVHHANRSLAFQTQSVDVFSRLTAQFRDARCDVNQVTGVVTMDASLASKSLSAFDTVIRE